MSDLGQLDRDDADPPVAGGRGRYRPPIGLPSTGESTTPGLVASLALHGLVILLLAFPMIFAKVMDAAIPPGAGGPGPAGGGGGGNMGTGGRTLTERLQYLHITAPIPMPAVNTPPPLPLPPVPTPPVEKKEDVPMPAPAAPTPAESAPVAGTGGGTGSDGTAGSGPGTGGGVGSGHGTGTGSGTGPGTGGGNAEIFPPTLTQLALLPLPVPGKVRPYTMVASFDVDERGNAKLIGFTPSKDGGYNRRIMDMLREIRFRPAVRKDGTPVRDTAVVTAIAP